MFTRSFLCHGPAQLIYFLLSLQTIETFHQHLANPLVIIITVIIITLITTRLLNFVVVQVRPLQLKIRLHLPRPCRVNNLLSWSLRGTLVTVRAGNLPLGLLLHKVS